MGGTRVTVRLLVKETEQGGTHRSQEAASRFYNNTFHFNSRTKHNLVWRLFTFSFFSILLFSDKSQLQSLTLLFLQSL